MLNSFNAFLITVKVYDMHINLIFFSSGLPDQILMGQLLEKMVANLT